MTTASRAFSNAGHERRVHTETSTIFGAGTAESGELVSEFIGTCTDAVSGCRHTENVQGAQRTKSREQKAHLNGRQNGSRWI